MDPLSVTASIIAVLQATNAVVSVCYDYSSAIKGSSWELTKVTEEVKSLRNVLENLEQLAKKAESTYSTAVTRLPTLKLLCHDTGQGAPLANCLLELKRLNKKLCPPSWSGRDGSKRRAFVQAVTWPLKEGDTRKILESIGSFKETLSLALDADQATMLLAIQDMTRITQDTTFSLENNIVSMKIDNVRENIKKWLSAPDPSSNHNKACKQRQARTGNWFVEGKQFTDWKILPHSFIWLHGIPGCGKTILSSTIIENILQYCHLSPARVVAYFYFDFNDLEKQRPEKMLRSIITQLSFQSPSTPRALNALFSSCKDGEQQPTAEALITTLHHIIQDLGETFVVLDALDECNDRMELLEYIEIIAGWQLGTVHMIATSRREKDLEDYFGPLLEEQNRICIQSVEVDEDILLYVHERLQTDRSLSRWKTSPKAQEEIEVALMNKARGMFRWAVCQLDALKNCFNIAMLRKTLASLPRTLDETYLRILCSIEEAYSQQAFTILQWLVYSARPLQLEELAEVLIVDMEGSPYYDINRRFPDPQDVLTICSSLVTTAPEEVDSFYGKVTKIIVRLAHFSVQEYLVSDRIRNSCATRYRVQEMSANQSMAEICLAYLLHFDEPDSLDKIEETSSEDSDSVGWNSHLEKMIKIEFPLAEYAATNWTRHARVAGENAGAILRLASELVLVKEHTFVNLTRLQDLKFDPEVSDNEPDMLMEATRLYYMAWAGLGEMTRLVLDSGADIDMIGGTCGTALQVASYRGDHQICQLLLHEGADVNTQGGKYGNALQAASCEGHHQICQLLLKERADVNAQGGYFGNALKAASYMGHHQLCQLLLKEGADVNAQGGKYDNALQAASYRGHHQVCQLLLKERADVNAQGGEYSNVLQAATCEDHHQLCQLLLKGGADVNAQVVYFGNALEAASYMGHHQVCQLLLKEGADVNAQGGEYSNALEAASYRGHHQVCQLLLKEGADVNAQGGKYGNALQAASRMGHHQLCQLLLKEGADVNAQGGGYSNALQAASCMGHHQVCQLLLKEGADVNARGHHHGNVLKAVGDHQLCQLLLREGEDVNHGNALQAASYEGHHQVCQLLLKEGVDVNAQGGVYGTALRAAAIKNRYKIVQFLLENGADPNQRGFDSEDREFDTALRAARNEKYNDIVQLLLDHGADASIGEGYNYYEEDEDNYSEEDEDDYSEVDEDDYSEEDEDNCSKREGHDKSGLVQNDSSAQS